MGVDHVTDLLWLHPRAPSVDLGIWWRVYNCSLGGSINGSPSAVNGRRFTDRDGYAEEEPQAGSIVVADAHAYGPRTGASTSRGFVGAVCSNPSVPMSAM